MQTLLAAAIVTVAGIAAYSNSFKGTFVFDDIEGIVQNTHIESILPLSRSMSAPKDTTPSGRPMVSLSLAINYAISKRDVWSYHALNLSVHLAAGLLLLGIIRRTLLGRSLVTRFGKHASVLAGICALLWVVHPVNTQAVTYLIQRAESIMGLFYLLTLYCVIRGFASPRAWVWYTLAVLACAAGMGTKEVMVTAPLMVLIYDRLFASGSFRGIFSRRWGLYCGLAATWVILGLLVSAGPRTTSAGFGLQAVTPLTYAQTQFVAIVHYLRLGFYPSPLILDYTRKVAKEFADFAPHAGVILILLVATAIALRYRRAVAFLGVWFFITLAPTSSFVPIADPIFEHRMYLPLGGVITGVVVGVYALLERSVPARRTLRIAGIIIAVALAVALGILTHRRNYDYHSEVAIWEDTVAKQGDSARAYLELGAAYRRAKSDEKAMAAFNKSLEINPDYPRAHLNRGVAHASRGDYDKALTDMDRAIALHPAYYVAYANRGVTYLHIGELEWNTNRDYDAAAASFARALADFDRALRLNPKDEWVMKGREEAADFLKRLRSPRAPR